MAEFLIKAVSATHPDPEKNARGCYKRGDIVDIRPDGWPWGAEERLPLFVLVKIPGLSVSNVIHYAGAYPDVARRLYKIRVDDVPLAIRNILRDTGVVTLTRAQVIGYVRNKLTNVDEV